MLILCDQLNTVWIQILNGRKLGVLKLGQRYVQVLNFLSICAEVHAQTVFIIANDGHSVSFYIMN